MPSWRPAPPWPGCPGIRRRPGACRDGLRRGGGGRCRSGPAIRGRPAGARGAVRRRRRHLPRGRREAAGSSRATSVASRIERHDSITVGIRAGPREGLVGRAAVGRDGRPDRGGRGRRERRGRGRGERRGPSTSTPVPPAGSSGRAGCGSCRTASAAALVRRARPADAGADAVPLAGGDYESTPRRMRDRRRPRRHRGGLPARPPGRAGWTTWYLDMGGGGVVGRPGPGRPD